MWLQCALGDCHTAASRTEPRTKQAPDTACGHVMGKEAVHRAPCSQDVEADVHEIPQATFSLQKSEVLPSGLPDPVAPCR